MADIKEFEYEYNPVKDVKDGDAAVIWTTKALNAAVDAINKGLPLKSNPFLGKNTKLIRPDLVYKRTKEEIEDYIKCMQDPVYFASKCFLMTPEGLQHAELRDYQIDYLHHLQNNRFSILKACRQAGKCQLLDSEVIIPKESFIKTFCDGPCLEDCSIQCYTINGDEVSIPLFEIYNLCNKSILWKIEYHLYKKIYRQRSITNNHHTSTLYKIISVIDSVRYVFAKDKFVDNYKLDDLQVKTDTGYSNVVAIMKTKPFFIYDIHLSNGLCLSCADTHIVFDSDYNEVFVKDLCKGSVIQTINGLSDVVSISKRNYKICMTDISLDDENHRFYSNGVLSHNSVTTAIYCLWKILFSTDKAGLILSKSGPAGIDLLNKVKDMFLFLPYYLKCGVMKWNQHEISFDNNSSISTEAFSPTAGLGKTINFLILDEFAWCPANDVELFYNNIIPTITTITDSNVCIMSTQNGFNLFYKLWDAAIKKESIYAPFNIDWWQVPQWNPDTKTWDKRDDKWKQDMIGVLGSEEAFYYQYGTAFAVSDFCIMSRERLTEVHKHEVSFEVMSQDTMPYVCAHPECFKVKPGYDISKFKTNPYIVLVDLAEGGGGDYTVFNVFEVVDDKTFDQVAYWRSNIIPLEMASLEFWLTFPQVFNPDLTLISIEWNTYGALFYNYLLNYNSEDYAPEYAWRFDAIREVDFNNIIRYKKGDNTEDIAGIASLKNSKYIPGIRFSASNKATACTLLKMMLNKGQVNIYDVVQISECENFEDKHGSGSYKASYGHDDMMMTLCQIPMAVQTPRFKDFLESVAEYKYNDNGTSQSPYFADLYGDYVPHTYKM